MISAFAEWFTKSMLAIWTDQPSNLDKASCLQILVSHVSKTHASGDGSDISEAARSAYVILQPALMNYLRIALSSPASHSFTINLETWLAWLDPSHPNTPQFEYIQDNFFYYTTLLADFVVRVLAFLNYLVNAYKSKLACLSSSIFWTQYNHSSSPTRCIYPCSRSLRRDEQSSTNTSSPRIGKDI
jgi:hypothetical protein